MATTTAGTTQDMYSVKPIHGDLNVEVPTCMYGMKSLHGSGNGTMINPELQSLLEKDKKIATDLVLLSRELQEMSMRLGHKFGESASALESPLSIKVKNFGQDLPAGILDLAISVSPCQPALSAVLIAELLESSGIHVALPTQKHSSLREEIPSHLLAATGGLSGRVHHQIEKLIFTFIWKQDVFAPSLMHSPRLQTRIMGDTNIARYLCRLFCPQLYDESNIDIVLLADKWIDTSVKISNGNSKEKDSAVKAMNAHLGRSQFFCGDSITLADITLLSAILANSNVFKSLPNNVLAWFNRMRLAFSNTVSRVGVPQAWCTTGSK